MVKWVKKAYKKYKKWEADAPKRRKSDIEKAKQRAELAKVKAEERKYKTMHRPKGYGGPGIGPIGFKPGGFFGPEPTPAKKVVPKKKKKRRYKPSKKKGKSFTISY